MNEEDKATTGDSRWKILLAWVLVVPFAVWALVRTFGLESGYPFVQIMAYTPYALVLLLLVLLAVGLLRQWLPLLLGALAAAALLIAVVPRELGGPDEVSGGTTVRVLSANLLHSRADFAQVLELARVRDADVITLQEFSPEGLEKIRALGVDKEYAYKMYATRKEAGGGAIYSRFPLKRVAVSETSFRQPRAVISPPGSAPFEVMSVHPMAPAGPRTTTTWSREFGDLPPADDPGPPKVLAGDFNATLDHEKMRVLLGTGYRDAGDVMGRGLISTWPSTLKWPLPVTLDHVLVEEPISITSYDVEPISGSDHRSVFAELVIPDS